MTWPTKSSRKNPTTSSAAVAASGGRLSALTLQELRVQHALIVAKKIVLKGLGGDYDLGKRGTERTAGT